jgi:hypothetical protein
MIPLFRQMIKPCAVCGQPAYRGYPSAKIGGAPYTIQNRILGLRFEILDAASFLAIP